MSKNNKSNPIKIIILFLVLITIITLVGSLKFIMEYRNGSGTGESIKPPSTSTQNPSEGTEIDVSDWKTYKNTGYKFQIKLPSSWKVGSENMLEDVEVITKGFSLGENGITFSDFGNYRYIQITVSDKEYANYNDGDETDKTQFVYGETEKISIGSPESTDVAVEGVAFDRRPNNCGDDNKVKNSTYLCYHSRIVQVQRGGLYYKLEANYMGTDGRNVIDNILDSFEFIEYEPMAGIFKENGITFNYPVSYGEYYKLEENSMQIYAFENGPDITMIFENEESTSLNGLCDEKANNTLSCKKIKFDLKEGIIKDSINCSNALPGGGKDCSFNRKLLLNTGDSNYPMLTILITLESNYSDPEFKKCFDETKELTLIEACFKNNYITYFMKYKEELNDFGEIVSSIKLQ